MIAQISSVRVNSARHRLIDQTPIVIGLKDTSVAYLRFLFAVSASILCLWSSIGVAAPLYTVKDLGSLKSGGSSYGTSLNNLGQVTGYSDAPGSSPRAFLYSNGTITNLGALGITPSSPPFGASYSRGLGINDGGQIVGLSEVVPGNPVHPVIFGDPVQDINVLAGLGSTFGAAQGINNNGQITGVSSGLPNGHAFIYSNGAMQDIGVLTHASYSVGQAINNLGQVAGYSQLNAQAGYKAFLYSNGTILDLGNLGGANSYSRGINDNGLVVGYSQIASGAEHAFLFSGGTMHDLGILPSTSSSRANAINASGKVVGYSSIAANNDLAFIYDSSNGMVNLNTLIDPSSGWVLQQAADINDVGQITGYGTINGVTHAFLLSPIGVPESSSLLLGALGIIFCAYPYLKRVTRIASLEQ